MVAGVALIADAGDGWGHMHDWGGAWMWLWGLAMMILFGLFLVWLVRSVASSSDGSRRADPTDRAREILAERFARGELSIEEYRERVSELK